eukprot:12091605-Prorocentrum_lima.AAC.1
MCIRDSAYTAPEAQVLTPPATAQSASSGCALRSCCANGRSYALLPTNPVRGTQPPFRQAASNGLFQLSPPTPATF